jgi:uncharacterized protein YcaQ
VALGENLIGFSRAAARGLLLAAQGLSSPPERPAAKGDVLECVRRMGVLQIDSIAVVARSPYLVLWSRLGPYEPRWLDELLAEGALFEYWSHAASLIPIEDYGLYRRFMLDGREKTRAWMTAHPEEIGRVLTHVREGGPVRSAEFARTDGRAGGWWEWKPEKRALEHLFAAGELMISRRDPNFHRVYDLRERVLERALPGWEDAHAPPYREVQRALALKAVRALGVAVARWVPDYFRTPKRSIAGLLDELADEGRLLRAWIEYRSEVYPPAARRRYGYYSLPILHRGALVGRLDAKAHRKEGLFEVRALHLEPGVSATEDLVSGLGGALRGCADWHGTPEISVRRSDPPQLVGPLHAATEAQSAKPSPRRGR